MSDSANARPRTLIIRVMMHEPRYHGRPEWPPSPARLFQALVAGAARGGELGPDAVASLHWLEGLQPPVIAVPPARVGQEVSLWVPNNDLDAKGGDPDHVSEIRTAKSVQPRLLSSGAPFMYLWELPSGPEAEARATEVSALAERLYQFGRGVDMAWAVGAVLDEGSVALELDAYPGRVLRPAAGGRATTLACPQPGSLTRLIERFEAGARFSRRGEGRKSVLVFAQPPMVSFAQVDYGGSVERLVFELQSPERMGSLHAWPLRRAHDLVVALRDHVADSLRRTLPDLGSAIEGTIIGQRPGEARAIPTEHRVRIVPLPSIGHENTDPAIRRVLVEIPHSGPVASADVAWAFSQVELSEGPLRLVPSEDRTMLSHYEGVRRAGSRRWRSITPVVVPTEAKRRRLEPSTPQQDPKGGAERSEEELRAIAAVRTALRHAGLRAAVTSIQVQREPFDRRGWRAEVFAAGTRFAKERLWHVDLEFESPTVGPLAIGDGRFLGLGVMQPAQSDARVLAFSILSGLEGTASPRSVAAALRRAVIARYQVAIGPRGRVPLLVSGHDELSGAPAKDQPHLHFVHDPARARLLVIAPGQGVSQGAFERVRDALEGFTALRAGAAGELTLRQVEVDTATDPLFAAATTWRSVTPYAVDRHRDLQDAEEAIALDVRAACVGAGLPMPSTVRATSSSSRSGDGLSGTLELTFAVAVAGPLLLGRTRFKGGGVFEGAG